VNLIVTFVLFRLPVTIRGLEDSTELILRFHIFWDPTPSSRIVESTCFEETCDLHVGV
jgi:hypothetical protein